MDNQDYIEKYKKQIEEARLKEVKKHKLELEDRLREKDEFVKKFTELWNKDKTIPPDKQTIKENPWKEVEF